MASEEIERSTCEVGDRRAPRARLVPWVLLVIAIGTVVADALTPRDLTMGEDSPVWNSVPDILAYQIMRAASAFALLASAVAVTRALVRRGFPRAGLSLWGGYMAFVLSCFILPGFTGRVPGFDVRLIYPPLVFTALYFARPVTHEQFLTLCRVALGVFVYGSLAAAIVSPTHALALRYEGLLPWPDFRLYGVGGGATSLGAQSAAFVAIELVSPGRSRARLLHITAGAAALFLTQAKTSWLFVFAVVGFLTARRIARAHERLSLGSGAAAKALKAIGLMSGVGAVAAFVAYRLAQVDVSATRGVAVGENLATFTGRTYIWATSLNAWLDDPVFGYGLGLWEGEFREKFAPLIPHAHNQFIHSLASAGVIGLLGLLVYLRASWRAARDAAPTTLVPAILLATILVQSLTNVPLRGYYLLEPVVVLHLLTFAALVNSEKLRRLGDAAAGGEVLAVAALPASATT